MSENEPTQEDVTGGVRFTEGLGVTVEELREICTLTVELVRLRQNECKHLCVENLGPEILHDLLSRLLMAKQGMLRAPVASDLGFDA